MGARVGFKCKLYIAPAPWISDPAWNPVNRVKDAEVSMEDGEADASDRGTGNYEATLSTLRKLEYSLKITHDPNDTRYQEIRDAFVNRTDLNVLGLSGDILDSGSEEQRARWLPGIADGSRIGTLALVESNDVLAPSGVALLGKPDGDAFVLTGTKSFVADAGAANLFVVAFRTGPGAEDLTLAVVDGGAPGVSAKSFPTMDQTKRVGTLVLDGARVPKSALLGAPGRAWPAIERLFDRGAIATTGEMIGAAEGALALTVQYAKDRIQFGNPIGKYQGVKHPLAEMYVDIESTKSLLYYAAWALDESPREVPRSASLAKAYASDAFARIGIDGVQLHGAVGYTAEYDIQLFLKRSKWARPTFGDSDFHYERVATLGGL